MKTLLHFCRFFLGIEDPDSSVTAKELALLLKYSYNSKVIVEIGTYEGKITIALAENSAGIVYTIDPFYKGRLGICFSEWIAKIYGKRKKLEI